MKVMIDEMWTAKVAAELRNLGHDAIAVNGNPELEGMADLDLLMFALTDQRVIVTENAKDFRRIANAVLAGGGTHAGLILTVARYLPRRSPHGAARLTAALHEIMQDDPPLTNLEIWIL